MKKVTIDSNSILDASTGKTMSQVIDFDKEYVTTETDKDTTYKAGEGISISSDNTISMATEDSPAIESADSTTAGIMKLYSETGSNSDGTMTQESITDELGSKAPTASPAFTGTPTAPTPSSSDTGSDRIATTAYVLSLLKNDPTIIDDILTALNGKLDTTTASSTYLTKTTADSAYLAKTTAGDLNITASTMYIKETGTTYNAYIGLGKMENISGKVIGMGFWGESPATRNAMIISGGVTWIDSSGEIKLSAPNGVYVNGTKIG